MSAVLNQHKIVILAISAIAILVGSVAYQVSAVPTNTVTTINKWTNVQPCDFEIFKDSTTYYAKNCDTGEITFSGPTAHTVINSAIDFIPDPLAGGKVIFRDGEYSITGTITVARQEVTLEGAGRDRTVFDWAGTTSGTMMTLSKSRLTMIGMTLDGNNIAGVNGIVTSGHEAEHHFQRVSFKNFQGVATDLTSGGTSGHFDTVFWQVFWDNNEVGVKIAETGIDFHSCIWTRNDVSMWLAGSNTNDARVFGGVFTSGATQVQITGPSQQVVFDGVWFETSNNTIINIPNSNTIVRKLIFDGSRLGSNGDVTKFMNLTNMIGSLKLSAIETTMENARITLGTGVTYSEIDNPSARNQLAVSKIISNIVELGTNQQNSFGVENRQNTTLGAGASTRAFTFFNAMPDTKYQVIVETTWGTTWWVTSRTTSGFTVNFGTPTPDGNQAVHVIARR